MKIDLPDNIRIIKRLAERACLEEKPYDDPRFPPSVYYRFFRLLTAWWKPELSVELGVCGGGGSLYMALGWPAGMVIGVDVTLKDHAGNIQYIINHCRNTRFVEMDSMQAAEQYQTVVDKPVDILFIDTVHTYDQTMAEFAAWYPKLNGSAIVCLDDLFRPGMQQAWDELPGTKIRLDSLHDGAENGGGFGVILL